CSSDLCASNPAAFRPRAWVVLFSGQRRTAAMPFGGVLVGAGNRNQSRLAPGLARELDAGRQAVGTDPSRHGERRLACDVACLDHRWAAAELSVRLVEAAIDR